MHTQLRVWIDGASKPHRGLAAGEVAVGGVHDADTPLRSREELNPRPQRDPAACEHPHPQSRMSALERTLILVDSDASGGRGHNQIDVPVAVDVSVCQASARLDMPTEVAGICHCEARLGPGCTEEHEIRLCVGPPALELVCPAADRPPQHTSVYTDEVQRAVQVQVDQRVAEAGQVHRRRSELRSDGAIREASSLCSAREIERVCLLCKVCQAQVFAGVTIDVGACNAHAGFGATIARESKAESERRLFEAPGVGSTARSL